MSQLVSETYTLVGVFLMVFISFCVMFLSNWWHLGFLSQDNIGNTQIPAFLSCLVLTGEHKCSSCIGIWFDPDWVWLPSLRIGIPVWFEQAGYHRCSIDLCNILMISTMCKRRIAWRPHHCYWLFQHPAPLLQQLVFDFRNPPFLVKSSVTFEHVVLLKYPESDNLS